MKPSLVILAAGIGSRYGGSKQMDGFGPNGETIIDYSIYDAVQAGFEKVVFVIRKQIESDFKEIFLNRFSGKIQAEYVFQELDVLPNGLTPPTDRVKPWGTGHAIMVSEERVHEPFAVINADDFYGRTSFELIYQHLDSLDPAKVDATLIGFRLANTLSEHGTVARGVCTLNPNQTLSHITEMTKISRHEDGKIYNAETEDLIPLDDDQVVSMNLMGFTPAIFPKIREYFLEFIQNHSGNLKSEFYMPSILDNIVQEGTDVPVLTSGENWIGVTYKEDKSDAVRHISNLITKGIYPENLWG